MAAIVMYENVGYIYPQGEGPGVPQTGFGPIEVPLDEFKKLTKVPMQVVWGDNVDKSASYSNSYKMALLFAEKVNKYGGKVQVLRLPLCTITLISPLSDVSMADNPTSPFPCRP